MNEVMGIWIRSLISCNQSLEYLFISFAFVIFYIPNLGDYLRRECPKIGHIFLALPKFQ